MNYHTSLSNGPARSPGNRQAGSAVLASLGVILVLALIASQTYLGVSRKYNDFFQSEAWHESLMAAESGIDLAMGEVRTYVMDPENAWDDWNDSSGGKSPGVGVVSTYTSNVILREPDAGAADDSTKIRSWASVSVDAMVAEDADPLDPPYYRIRTIGYSDIPGGLPRAPVNPENAKLRKLSLRMDRWKAILDGSATQVDRPRASRRIEAIAKPIGVFSMAVVGDCDVDFTGANVLIDSFDSEDPNYSDNGQYDEDKPKDNGDTGTNDSSTTDDPLDVDNVTIEGDLMWNGGDKAPAGTENVSGDLRDDFFMEMPPVSMPTGGPDADVQMYADIATLPAISGAGQTELTQLLTKAGVSLANNVEVKEMTATTNDWHNYQFDVMDFTAKDAVFIRGQKNADGTPIPTYVMITITGEETGNSITAIDMSAAQSLILDEGVYARIFFNGNVDIGGNAVINPGGRAVNLQLYGISATDDDGNPVGNYYPDGSVRDPIGEVKIAGNGGFTGAIYAPNYEVTLRGGGNSDEDIMGSFVGHTVRFNGHTSLHYDEQLRSGGLVSDYRIVTWWEDLR